MNNVPSSLLAAASAASSATLEMIEAAREGSVAADGNIGNGEAVTALADALHLLLDIASGETEEEVQLHGAVIRCLEANA